MDSSASDESEGTMKLQSKSLAAVSGAVAVALLSGTPADAQYEIHPLVVQGDPVPGVGNALDIFDLKVNDTGVWLAIVQTDNPDPGLDTVLLENGVMTLKEGQVLPEPLGSILHGFHSVSINKGGDHACCFFLSGTVPPALDEALYFNANLVLLAGMDVQIPQFGAGVTYTSFLDARLNDFGQILVSAHVDDPKIPGTLDHALLLLEVDAAGNLLDASVIFKEGDLLPGQVEPIEDFNSTPAALAFNNLGDTIFVASLAGNSAVDGVVYLNGTLLGQEGHPAPVKGRNWEVLCTCTSVGLNNQGDYVFKGELEGDPATAGLIVKNGQKFVQLGDQLPAFAPFSLTSFGPAVPLYIDDDGQVLWWGEWDDPDATKNSGLFLDYKLIVQEGVSQTTSGHTFTKVDGTVNTLAWSPNHRHLLFAGVLDTGQTGAFLVEMPIDPTAYCTAKTNSLGCQPSMIAFGTPSLTIGAPPFLLNATQLLNQSLGLLAYGFGEAAIPFMGGTLCIGGHVSRGMALSTAGNPSSPPDCSGALSLDFNALMLSGYDPLFIQGADVFGQYWSRDFLDPFGASLTNAIKFTILP
jgi:hypothetical protein